jgi:hypothetical protein
MTLLGSPCETNAVDFKETLDLSHTRDRVELAKDVLAMANSGGGDMVVGVEDGTLRRVGISEEVFVSLRDAKSVNDKLKRYCGGYVKVLVAQHQVTNQERQKVRMVLIHVPAASHKVPAQDDGAYADPGNPSKQKWIFRRGDVYVRKADESVKVETPEDLRAAPTSPQIDADTARKITHAYIQRLVESFTHNLSPLLPNDTPRELSGEALIRVLEEPRDVLLVGPSGSGKSHHLRHFCISVAKHNQLPIMVRVARYRGQDLLRVIDLEIAPFSTEGGETLCTAALINGLTVVLVLDGLNECEPFLENLASEVEAFRLRHSCRLIAASQTDSASTLAVRCERVFIAPLTLSQKRFIYCTHAQIAGTPEVDHLCQGFSNGYDLAVAGRCHDSNNAGFTRVDLYDRYCRDSLPQGTTVLTALLRDIAGKMGQELTNFWPRDDFERHAEDFLSKQRASLALLDHLKSCRLLSLTHDSFSFEHDLLLDYFRAERARREFASLDALGHEVAKPRSQALIPFLLPRYTEATELRALFASTSNLDVFREVIRGRCGETPRGALIQDCKELIRSAISDLPQVMLEFADKTKPGFPVVLQGQRQWSQYELALCDAIAVSLDDEELQKSFLELLDLTQWTLRAKAEEVAKQAGMSFGSLWAHIVGQLHIFSSDQLPFFRITRYVRERSSRTYYERNFPLADQLWKRVSVNSTDHFSISILLEGLSSCKRSEGHVDFYLALVEAAWESKIYHLRLEAMHLLHCIRRFLEEKHPEKVEEIRDFLGDLETKNFFLNASLLEAQVSYGALEPVVPVEQAILEMKDLVAKSSKGMKSEFELDPRDRAYSLISNIFEDIFQGAYYEAYTSLEPDERVALLCLAAQAQHAGFSAGFILSELLKSNSRSALPVFEQYASRIDEDSSSPQEAAGAFALGIAGCAKLMNQPPKYKGPSTADHETWKTSGLILFYTLRRKRKHQLPNSPVELLWAKLTNKTPMGAADALYRLRDGVEIVDRDEGQDFDLVAQYPKEAKPLLEYSLQNRKSLTSVFKWGGSRDEAVLRFVIESLGLIGDKNTIQLLQHVSDDPKFGANAIAAIRKIRESTVRR